MLAFDFEIGLSPEFDVNLKNKKAIPSYEIDVDKKMIDDQIKNIQNQYGTVFQLYLQIWILQEHLKLLYRFKNIK